MLTNVNLDKNNFDSLTEIIKIKNSLVNIIKNKLSNNEELITKLRRKLKKIHDTKC